MLSQDSRTHKAVGVVAHLGDTNCFVKDHAQLSPLLCSLFRCELTQRHASESPLKYPIYLLNLGNSIWQSWHVFVVALETGNIFCCFFFSFFSTFAHFFAKGNLKILHFFSTNLNSH